MAFAGVLNDAEMKAALDGCSGELHYLNLAHSKLYSECTALIPPASLSSFAHHDFSLQI